VWKQIWELSSKLQEKNCLALGECGLDKGLKSRWNCNKRFFEKQLLHTVVIHCVAAFQEVIDTKRD
jgi:TatD DNase family protein